MAKKKEDGWSRFRRLYTNYYFSELSKSVKDKRKLKSIVKSRMRKDYDSGFTGWIKENKKASKAIVNEKRQSTFDRGWVKATQNRLIDNATKEEVFVRNYLESKNIDFGFQYHFRVDGHLFYPDFYFKKNYAILEVDGGYHKSRVQRDKDSVRDSLFRKMGVETYRITNDDAMDINKLDYIVKIILSRNSPIVTSEESCIHAHSNNVDMDNEFLSIISTF